MSRKLYFCDQIDNTNCFLLSTLKTMASWEYLTEIRVRLAKRETNSDYFFCKKFQTVGEKSDGGCGKWCDQYKPRNGKSGRCRHSDWCYEPVGEKITVKIKGAVQ